MSLRDDSFNARQFLFLRFKLLDVLYPWILMKTLVKFALAASLLSVVACNKNSSADAATDQDAQTNPEVVEMTELEEAEAAGIDQALLDQEWVITELDGTAFDIEKDVVLLFTEEGRLAGNAGCNNIIGSYSVTEEGQISIGMVGTTMMMCDDAAMEVERDVVAFLPTVTGYAIDADNNLTLQGEDDRTATGAAK